MKDEACKQRKLLRKKRLEHRKEHHHRNLGLKMLKSKLAKVVVERESVERKVQFDAPEQNQSSASFERALSRTACAICMSAMVCMRIGSGRQKRV